MTVAQSWIIYAVLVVVGFCAGVGAGWSECNSRWTQKDTSRKLEEATASNAAWAERFTLQAQLATRDQQLAEAQAKSAQVRTVEVIKREVVYRDRIKEVAVRDCVANSGMLQLIDAAYGLSDAAGGYDGHASASDGH